MNNHKEFILVSDGKRFWVTEKFKLKNKKIYSFKNTVQFFQTIKNYLSNFANDIIYVLVIYGESKKRF